MGSPNTPGTRDLGERPSSFVEFHDVHAGVVVRAVDEPVAVHKHVCGLDDAGAVRSMIHHSSGGRRHQGADFNGPKWIADVKYAHPRILVGSEDQLRAHEAAGAVLMDVVWPEMAALAHVIGLGGGRECRDADGIGRLPVVEDPYQLQSV